MKNSFYASLLEFIDGVGDVENIEQEFFRLATQMLLENFLVVNRTDYQLLEIELYFFHKDTYPDPYSHSVQYPNRVRLKQSVTGSWYFHRFTGMEKYHHTRRGLDLTFGDGEQEKFGGILIRSIKPVHEDRIISGPSKVVGEIISTINNPEELERIAFDMNAGLAFDPDCLIHLKSANQPLELPIYASSRYGLSGKNLIYQNKKQRFVSDLKILKRNTPYEIVKD